MATNDFLPFAVGGSANVLSQSAYAALSAITNGYSSGVAQSAALNKTWRQSSIMAAVLAQFISDQTGANSADDGTTATLLANLKKSMPGRLLGIQVFTASSAYTPGTYNGITATKARVRAIGAGGAGGGAAASGASTVSIGAGGCAGAYGELLVTSGLSSQTVTIGAGGTGVSGGSTGNAGGSTSFGALMVCGGGPGGVSSGAAAAAPIIATPGTGSPAAVTGSGTLIVVGRGALGGMGLAINASAAFISGQGANSQWGQGGQQSISAGLGANGPGAGGSGALSALSGAAAAGGPGGNGYLIVEEYA
ncbi:hypothetical protein [Caballeronia telluris]|uniref:Uncharacterized protein n=1 Tax=Caballeronia telluris TaxID=326475 RepID=A0A158G1S1_9BURK|nr:hypothetical protein [Caballeronia telluris]SAL25579.1 hypothetical protein AWB66_01468 [Caballeronia telluris]